MSVPSIVPQQARYVVTPEGRAAASAEETCVCMLERSVCMLVCRFCKTGWSLTRPQAARARNEKRA